MAKPITKSRLGIILSQLEVFTKPKVALEQYPTDSEIAAEILWNAYLQGDIVDKTVADLGCGTGILGIGALILGAEQVYFVDIDPEALELCESNIKMSKEEYRFKGSYIVKKLKVSSFDKNVDVVIQNPPFGAKTKNADREFLEKSIEIGSKIYSMHNAATKKFIDKFIVDKNCKVTHYWEFMFPLKQSMQFHEKKVTKIRVGCWRIVKQYRN